MKVICHSIYRYIELGSLWQGFYVHGWQILVPRCIYCLNCTKFGKLIPRKIMKI